MILKIEVEINKIFWIFKVEINYYNFESKNIFFTQKNKLN